MSYFATTYIDGDITMIITILYDTIVLSVINWGKIEADRSTTAAAIHRTEHGATRDIDFNIATYIASG